MIKDDLQIIHDALDAVLATDQSWHGYATAMNAFKRIEKQFYDPKNYGHVIETVNEAHREKDHVALIIIGDDGSTCIQICPRTKTSDRACVEAITRTMLHHFLEDEYSRNDSDKLRAIINLQDLTQDAVRKFVRDGEEEE